MNDHKWFVRILIILSIIIGLLWCLTLYFKLYVYEYSGFFLVLSFIPACYLLFLLICSEYSNHQSKSLIKKLLPSLESNISQSHHAIVIAKSNRFTKRGGIYTGINILIKKLENEEKPFYIYECEKPEQAEKAICSEKSQCLWIFGHGFRGGLKFYSKKGLECLFYNNLEMCGPKNFIAQMHCNGGKDFSLPEILSKNHSVLIENFVVNGYRFHIQNWLDIKYHLTEKITKI